MMFCSSISYGVLQHIEASVVLDDGDLEVKCGLWLRVISGQNWVWLLDAALAITTSDTYKKGLLKSKVSFTDFYNKKLPSYTSSRWYLQFLEYLLIIRSWASWSTGLLIRLFMLLIEDYITIDKMHRICLTLLIWSNNRNKKNGNKTQQKWLWLKWA